MSRGPGHYPLHRVLLAEDSKSMRAMELALLQELGVTRVDQAENGLQARQLLLKHRYQLILCDWDMPELSGLDLLRQVRHHPATQDLPFILCTANASRDEILLAVKAGVSDYITKPFQPAALLAKLDLWLAKIPAPNLRLEEQAAIDGRLDQL
ncbi:MAG: response regulator [Gammaproteobacteria bacterium]|nr:response regulator [Gammaproteobacteria bacterium]